MAHKKPEQLSRLVSRLNHPNSDIYVHLDKKVCAKDMSKFKDIRNVTFIENRLACNWGGNSLLMAIIGSVEEVLATEKDYDFVNLLSGQDYPLLNAERMFKYFQSNKNINFLDFEESFDCEWWQTARSRYEKYHFTDYDFPGRYVIQKVINKLAPKRKFPYRISLFGSNKSTWWSITGDCAKYITERLKRDKMLVSFLKYSWGTDEFVISSLIMNTKFKDQTINNNLRYIDWSHNKVNPKILTIDDFEKLKDSNMLFARKFDSEVDVKILDEIDDKLLCWRPERPSHDI